MRAVPAFRASVGEWVARASVAGLAGWWVARIALRGPTWAGLLAGLAAVIGLLAPAVARWRRIGAVRVDADGFTWVHPGGSDRFVWAAMGPAEREVRALDGAGRGARVTVVRVPVADGASLVLADFGPWGGATPADAAERVLDVENADALAAWIPAPSDADRPPAAFVASASPRAPRVWPVHTWAGAGTIALLAVRAIDSLWDGGYPGARVAATAVSLCAGGALAGRALLARAGRDKRGGSVGGALFVAIAATLVPGISPALQAWTLACGLALALPAPMLPGFVLPDATARALGARAQRWLLGATLGATALLLLRGMTLVPASLLAGLLGGLDAARAHRRSVHFPSNAQSDALRPRGTTACPELDAPAAVTAELTTLPSSTILVALLGTALVAAVLARALLHAEPAAGAVLRAFLG